MIFVCYSVFISISPWFWCWVKQFSFNGKKREFHKYHKCCVDRCLYVYNLVFECSFVDVKFLVFGVFFLTFAYFPSVLITIFFAKIIENMKIWLKQSTKNGTKIITIKIWWDSCLEKSKKIVGKHLKTWKPTLKVKK